MQKFYDSHLKNEEKKLKDIRKKLEAHQTTDNVEIILVDDVLVVFQKMGGFLIYLLASASENDVFCILIK